MEEIWKDIKGYEGFYQVSNLGRVKSLDRIVNGGYRSDTQKMKSKLLKPTPNEKGYLRVFLCENGKAKTKYVHRLVAEAFILNSNNLPEVNHKSGNKKNNSVSNLEWISKIDNVRHSIITGLTNKKKKIVQYNQNFEIIKIWDSAIDIERKLNIPHQTTSKRCKNQNKSKDGFYWRYYK